MYVHAHVHTHIVSAEVVLTSAGDLYWDLFVRQPSLGWWSLGWSVDWTVYLDQVGQEALSEDHCLQPLVAG